MGWPWLVVHLLGFLAKIKAAILEKLPYTQTALNGKLMSVKLYFFERKASIIESYLKRYQTETSGPFHVPLLEGNCISVVGDIMKPAVLDSFKIKPQTWKDIDLSKDNNLISAWKLDLWFAVDEDISNFKKNHPTNTDEKISKFRGEAKCFIVAMVSKLFERSPLRSARLKSASVLDRDVFQGNTRDKLITRFKTLLKVIMNVSVLVTDNCDKALYHFKYLLDNDLKELRLDTIKFVQEDERLNDFYFKRLNAENRE